jgi:copper chaperone
MLKIHVENIKCAGCARSIEKGLMAINGVQSIAVDVAAGLVSVDGEVERELLVNSLLKMGYPEQGSVQGLNAAKAKATSFVSCAIGKIDRATSK